MNKNIREQMALEHWGDTDVSYLVKEMQKFALKLRRRGWSQRVGDEHVNDDIALYDTRNIGAEVSRMLNHSAPRKWEAGDSNLLILHQTYLMSYRGTNDTGSIDRDGPITFWFHKYLSQRDTRMIEGLEVIDNLLSTINYSRLVKRLVPLIRYLELNGWKIDLQKVCSVSHQWEDEYECTCETDEEDCECGDDAYHYEEVHKESTQVARHGAPSNEEYFPEVYAKYEDKSGHEISVQNNLVSILAPNGVCYTSKDVTKAILLASMEIAYVNSRTDLKVTVPADRIKEYNYLDDDELIKIPFMISCTDKKLYNKIRNCVQEVQYRKH